MGISFSSIINCADFKPWNVAVLVRDKDNTEKIIQINTTDFDQKSFTDYINNPTLIPSFIVKETYKPSTKLKAIINKQKTFGTLINDAPIIETYEFYNQIKNKLITTYEDDFIAKWRHCLNTNTLESNSEIAYIKKKRYPMLAKAISAEFYILIIPSENMHNIINWDPKPGDEANIMEKESELIDALNLNETLLKAALADNSNEMPNVKASDYKEYSKKLLDSILGQNYKGRKLIYTSYIIAKDAKNQIFNIRDLNNGNLSLLEEVQATIYDFMKEQFGLKYSDYLIFTMHPTHRISCLSFTISYYNTYYNNRIHEFLSYKLHILYDIIQNIKHVNNYYQTITLKYNIDLSTYNLIYKGNVSNIRQTNYNKFILDLQKSAGPAPIESFGQCYQRYLNYIDNKRDTLHGDVRKGYFCKMGVNASQLPNTGNFYNTCDMSRYKKTIPGLLEYNGSQFIKFNTDNLIIYRFYQIKPMQYSVFAKRNGQICYFEIKLHKICIDFQQLLSLLDVKNPEQMYITDLGNGSYTRVRKFMSDSIYNPPFYIDNFQYLNSWNEKINNTEINELFHLSHQIYQRIFVASTNEIASKNELIRSIPESNYNFISKLVQRLYFGLNIEFQKILEEPAIELNKSKLHLEYYYYITYDCNFVLCPDKKWLIKNDKLNLNDPEFHFTAWFIPSSFKEVLFYKMNNGKYFFRIWKDCLCKNSTSNCQYRYLINPKNLNAWLDENKTNYLLDNFRQFYTASIPENKDELINIAIKLTGAIFNHFNTAALPIKKPDNYLSDLTDLKKSHVNMLINLENETVIFLQNIGWNFKQINMYVHDTNSGSQATLHIHFTNIIGQYYVGASENTHYSLRLYTTDLCRLYDELEMLQPNENFKLRRLLLDNKAVRKLQTPGDNYVIIRGQKIILYDIRQ